MPTNPQGHAGGVTTGRIPRNPAYLLPIVSAQDVETSRPDCRGDRIPTRYANVLDIRTTEWRGEAMSENRGRGRTDGESKV
jgi:hypothetical protein